MANTTDKLVPEEMRSSPYYNDYDETKGFYGIGYRPGYAVQARELTQMQTIAQKQIERFGKGIYQDGSLVTGGQITVQGSQENIQYLNLKSQYANTNITANNFVNRIIVSTNTATGNATARGYVLAADELNSSEPPTLIIKKLNGIPFLSNDTIQILNQSVYANIDSGVATGNASVVSIDTGVVFINGYFVRIEPQTISLDKYDNSPTYRVGLEFEDDVVDETDDTSLLDPAQEASNYQAPGATRYKIELVLNKRTLESTDDTNFVELLRIKEGEIQKLVSGPGYSVIGDTMARRTYDQSGNFTVRPFIGELHEHVPDLIDGTVFILPTGTGITGTNTSFFQDLAVGARIYTNNQVGLINAVSTNTSATSANVFLYGSINQPAYVENPNKFTFKLSPGKGYVAGYEFQTISPTSLTVDRGREFANLTNYNLDSPMGNFLYVTNVKGLPDIQIMDTVDLHIVPHQSINFNSSSAYSNTKIGTARIRAFEYSSGPVGNSMAQIYSAYLFDVNVSNSTYSFADVNSLAQFANTSQYTKKMNIDLSSKDNNAIYGNTFLNDTPFNTLVFPFPQSTVVPSSITDVDYQFRKISKSVTFTAGVGVITLTSPESFVGSGTLSDSQKLTNFTVTVRDNRGIPDYANGDVISLGTSNGRSVVVSPITTATITTNTANTFIGDVVYSVGITGTAPSPRVKTLVSANTTNVAVSSGTTISNTNTTIYLTAGQSHVTNQNNVVKVSGTPQKLYVSDVKNLVKVYDFNGNSITQGNLGSATDITSRYVLDNGQRDNYYDQASISLKSGATAPTGPLLICYNYYSHSGTSGYLTVDSYPNSGTNDGYANVPAFVSPTTGVTYQLRDCIDWRPKRINASEANTLIDSDTGSTSYILQPGEDFVSTFSYYLPRIDKVLLTQDLEFKVLKGIPNLYPEPPVEGQTDMLLYTLQIPAYTFSANTVDVIYNENKRYTMRDIGILEKRIAHLEYYSSLNLLETSATNLSIIDSNGLNSFKNGIIVDNFSGHSVGDVAQYDYACSMDFNKNELHAMFLSNNATFTLNSGSSSNYVSMADQITLSYDLVEYVSQPNATQDMSINPFNFATYIGSLMLDPDTDTWYDTQTRPQVLVNLDGSNDAWEAIGNALVSGGPTNGFGTQYGDWQTTWSGVTASDTSQSTNTFQRGNDTVQQNISTTTNTITTDQQRSYSTTTLTTQQITQSIGNQVVDASIEPYIRARDIIVHANGMQPSSVVYPFFDGKSVQGYWMNPLILKVAYPYTGEFRSDLHNEVITSSSGGKGILTAQPWADSLAASTIYPYLTLVRVTGTFNVGDTITGSVSGASATVTQVLKLTDTASGTHAQSNGIYLSAATSVANNIPVGHTINIAKGTGAGQVRIVRSYDNVSKSLIVTEDWTTRPDSTSVYSVSFPRTSPHGVISGEIAIPNSDTLRFLSGAKQVLLTSNPSGITTDAATYAIGTYYAQGMLETVQNTVISTRVPKLVTTTGVQTQVLQNQVVSESTVETVIATIPTIDEPVVIPIDPEPVTPPAPCFARGTLVWVYDNEDNDLFAVKPIEEIKVGDQVYAFDDNLDLVISDVDEVFYHASNAGNDAWKLVELRTDNPNTVLNVTRNHPIIVVRDLDTMEREWIHVGDLKIGDMLINSFNSIEKVTSISDPLPDQEVYNLHVRDTHTYYANGISVHNGCGCGGGQPQKTYTWYDYSEENG